MPISRARRRYTWRLAAAMAAFLLTFALAEYGIGHGGATGATATLLALLPGCCVAAVFWALGRLLIEETDEFRRMLLTRELLIATGITMTVVTIWGFLAEYQILPYGHAFYPVWLFFFAQGIGGIINKLTFGSTGCA